MKRKGEEGEKAGNTREWREIVGKEGGRGREQAAVGGEGGWVT